MITIPETADDAVSLLRSVIAFFIETKECEGHNSQCSCEGCQGIRRLIQGRQHIQGDMDKSMKEIQKGIKDEGSNRNC